MTELFAHIMMTILISKLSLKQKDKLAWGNIYNT